MNDKTKRLIIVESPAKAKTINKIVGKDYKVTASVGHIIDLPPKRLGVDIDKGFRPEYETIKGKGKIISELKKEASTASEVLIATDPDREGEAIAYHIARTINSANEKILRIEFNEITQNAVLSALERPRRIDDARVDAQQARRVMDRIVGYQVSPILWATIFRGLSAGRVQSVALRLIVEREEEIDKFNPVEYWTVDAVLKTENKEEFKARLIRINDVLLDPGKFRIGSQKEAEEHRKSLQNEKYTVSEIEKKTISRNPAPPFITSTLQQEASRRFRMTTSRVMSIAQQLYEGIDLGPKGNVGLITYMRTDSTRISDEAVQKARDYIAASYGPDFLPAGLRKTGKRKGAQDAHEAIRPTYIYQDYEPKKLKKFLSADQLKIYELIWRRFVASQMKPAEIEKTVVFIKAGKYLFRAEGEVIVFRGYLLAYEEDKPDPEDLNEEQISPENIPKGLISGQLLLLMKLLVEQKFTQPPPRYTESTLVKTLDKLDIGRPSTYAQIISTLFMRKYVERLARAIKPTDLGRTVIKLLVNHFPDIFNVKFTARMEDNLDKIEKRKSTYVDTLQEFYGPFHESLQRVKDRKKEIKEGLQEETGITCDVCGRPMVIKWGRNGRFYACSGFPACKNTKPIEEVEAREVEEKCEVCGSSMQVRRGRYGEFLACSNYPNCKFTKAIGTGVKCPEEGCGGEIVQRQSKKGKIFYSCSNYPTCKFALWDKPVDVKCPQCGYPLMVEKSSNRGSYIQCPSCKFKKQESEN
ncbi:MAG: type I DNA topoisomerase [Calditrichaeota bacterium]|nr:type I DNA topoisomerase [Calditrichota bacterium]